MDSNTNNIDTKEKFSEQKPSENGKKLKKRKVVIICLAAVFVCVSAIVTIAAIRQDAQTAIIYYEMNDEKTSYQLNREESDKVKEILLRKRREYNGYVPRCFGSYNIYVIVGDTKIYLSGDECNVALECDASDNLNAYNNDKFNSFNVSDEDFEYIKSLYESHLDSMPW